VVFGESFDVEMSPDDLTKIERIAATLRGYRHAATAMLDGKYAALRSMAPTHMTDACCSMAFVLKDGIIVRYDLKSEPDQKGIVGIVEGDGAIEEWAPKLSGGFVHCPVDAEGYDPSEHVATLTFSVEPVDRSAPSRTLVSQKLYAVAGRSPPSSASPTNITRRPVPLVGIRNEFDIQLLGELETGRRFVSRSLVKLPFGWEAFEIFPPYDCKIWDPDSAPGWAESDLLASAVQGNLAEEHFRQIDPSAQAQKRVAQMLDQFKNLLDGPEEPLHQYIKAHPQLLLPTQVQSWSKLPMAARVTDFVLRDATGDSLFVELESPTHVLFAKKGKPRAALEHSVCSSLSMSM
jgi:hypothetical protein